MQQPICDKAHAPVTDVRVLFARLNLSVFLAAGNCFVLWWPGTESVLHRLLILRNLLIP